MALSGLRPFAANTGAAAGAGQRRRRRSQPSRQCTPGWQAWRHCSGQATHRAGHCHPGGSGGGRPRGGGCPRQEGRHGPQAAGLRPAASRSWGPAGARLAAVCAAAGCGAARRHAHLAQEARAAGDVRLIPARWVGAACSSLACNGRPTRVQGCRCGSRCARGGCGTTPQLMPVEAWRRSF